LFFPFINFIRNYRYARIIRHNGISKAKVEWRMFVRKVAEHMEIAKPVQVWMSALVTSPVTIGYLKPVILLPMAAVNNLSTSQIEAILLHELSHIRRSDYLINLITKIIQTILYFNPFVKAFARSIAKERERSCDEMVMQFQYEPHGYASALLTLEKTAASIQHINLAMAAASSKKSELLHRIELIVGIKPKAVFSFNKLAGVLAGLLCFISLNALLIFSQPAKSKSDNSPVSLMAQLSSPFHFSSDNSFVTDPLLTNHELNTDAAVAMDASIKQASNITNTETTTIESNDESDINMMTNQAYPYQYISTAETVLPELDELQEEQVKEALATSKRVIEETKWKDLEKNIADAMTMAQKVDVKAVYQKAMSKADWSKAEEQLKIGYEKIDWPAVNLQLSEALVQIRMDSLQQVYNIALSNLTSLEKELTKTQEKGIPDTDITRKKVEEKRTEMEKAINRLKVIRSKKVIHL
jgi:bla regulator protein blaR1